MNQWWWCAKIESILIGVKFIQCMIRIFALAYLFRFEKSALIFYFCISATTLHVINMTCSVVAAKEANLRKRLIFTVLFRVNQMKMTYVVVCTIFFSEQRKYIPVHSCSTNAINPNVLSLYREAFF